VADELGRAYPGTGITVFYDRARCVHFAACVRGLPQVFDTGHRPWIDPAHGEAEAIAEVVRRCPTGALHYALDEGPAEQPESPTVVTPTSWGPVYVRGDLRVQTAGGVRTETRLALCGCGRTGNAPLCDQACRVAQ
jgi:uncharacterized Fe-S cluster protein YjdI